MKLLVISNIALVISSLSVFAQPFTSSEIVKFKGSENVDIHWADMNDDGKLDVVVFVESNEMINAFALIQHNPSNFQYQVLPIDSISDVHVRLKDFDHDGSIDIIYLRGERPGNLAVARNMGNWTFNNVGLGFTAKNSIIHDVDFDGDEDLIVSGKNESGNDFVTWIKNDSTFIEMNRIYGISIPASTHYIDNQRVLGFVRVPEVELSDQLAAFSIKDDFLQISSIEDFPSMQMVEFGDLDHDGEMDLVAGVRSKETGAGNGIYYKSESGYDHDTIAISNFGNSSFLIADLDLDGLADILLTGQGSDDAKTIFYKNENLRSFSPDSVFFDINEGFRNVPADVDDDGDLDILSAVLKDDTIKCYIQLNQAIIPNNGPNPVFIYPPLTIYDQTFFSWQRTSDDHTTSQSISYELFLQQEATGSYHVMPGYDMDSTRRNGFRKVVGNGYQWFDTTYTAHQLENGRYHWGVVGMDNAFYASSDIRKCKGGPCFDYYTPLNCLDLIVEDTTVCFNSEITIDPGMEYDSISWFSVRYGFLSKSRTLTYRVLETDTIFAYFFPQIPCDEETSLCVLNYSLGIDVEKREASLFDDHALCPDSAHVISVDGDWNSINWWYDGSLITTGSEIVLDSIPEIPIVAQAYDSLLCAVYDTLFIEMKERSVDITGLPDTISVCQDRPVQLEPFASFDTHLLEFLWLPLSVFDDPTLTQPTITTSSSGSIEVVITENRCFIDTVQFDLKLYALPNISTSGDAEIFIGEETLLTAEGAESYIWEPNVGLSSPSSKSTLAGPTNTTSYTVIGTDSNKCGDEASLTVFVKKSIFIPDLFSPNGDGNNDYFKVYGEEIQELSFKVFDDKGSQVYEINGNAVGPGWDGNYAGRELPSGTYFWTVNGRFNDGQPLSYQGKNKGTVRLIR